MGDDKAAAAALFAGEGSGCCGVEGAEFGEEMTVFVDDDETIGGED